MKLGHILEMGGLATVFEISLRNANLLNIPFAFKFPLINLPKVWTNFNNENIKKFKKSLGF